MKKVSIAIITTLMLIIGIALPGIQIAHASTASVNRVTPDTPYRVYLYINGQLQDVTALSAYNENHVFYQSQYVGDRTGTNGMTIVSPGTTNVIGYLTGGIE